MNYIEQVRASAAGHDDLFGLCLLAQPCLQRLSDLRRLGVGGPLNVRPPRERPRGLVGEEERQQTLHGVQPSPALL
eukprot:CAMPEP_0117049090 /NCGR_PEP_ID=MMETSP0472-20121206/33930_1 /TAXON_ID=693140 ORGANISM="Tiarina fusus, Strain LIS" /NCGR_SAMPLE_ID=MMETSP0472 /ASSEMBLY_ACC=CAM_ASM_000603 /LENGTH=75 /DNA_ID=CAMNT_0004762431 /DNA_START=73 /DNA_END=296 /DNA_ORIENTATION=-